jgi:hypothetical protein
MSDMPKRRHRLPNGRFDYEYQALTQEFLTKYYLEERLSSAQIGQLVGCSKHTVLQYLRKFNIPRRTSSYGRHIRAEKHFNITNEVKNYIDGLLLGDGHIFQKNNWSARYDQGFSVRFVDWTKKIREDFQRFGIESNQLITTNKETVIKKTGQHIGAFGYVVLFTKFYEEFVAFRRRWYQNGVKVIPKDIELTPQALANWYMGDGYYDDLPLTKRVAFSTHSFSNEDITFLVRKLSETYGFCPKIYYDRNQDNQPIIKLSCKDAERFLEITEPFKVSCFNYKWGNAQ